MQSVRFSHDDGKGAQGLFAFLLAIPLALAAAPAFAGEAGSVNEPPRMPEAMHYKPAAAAKPFNALPVDAGRTARVGGEKLTVRESVNNDVGFAVPDTNGDYIWVPAPVKGSQAGHADARELKLRVRELAAQLISGMDPSLKGMVALPASFVNQENFSQSSPLGRFMAEQLIYEFNQRGFPVREYRMASSLTAREGEGEFILSRSVAAIPANTPGVLFVAGTYFVDRQAVFINARLVRGNGVVLRTAQLVLPNSAMTRRMLAGSGKAVKAGSLPIEDFRTRTQPTNLTPFDQGEDVH
ncbi:MAG: hypothetical protein LBV01_06175 [Deltaproteobacteria bacterium]|jgi:hypothetical protein|nr:hypothetical protein [Deltaproteobacteria bacterium]